MSALLTSDYDQSCETGEGGNIQLHAMQALRKLQDGVNPVPETSDTLCLVKHGTIAEDELVCFRIRAFREEKRYSKLNYEIQLNYIFGKFAYMLTGILAVMYYILVLWNWRHFLGLEKPKNQN